MCSFELSACLLILYFQSSFIGAIAIGDLIKSTLGPKGMVKYCYIFTFKLTYYLPLTEWFSVHLGGVLNHAVA